MTTQTEALNLAISRLEWFIDAYPHDITTSKEDFLRPFKEALAQPEQEPVAHRMLRKTLDGEWKCDGRYWVDGPPSNELVADVALRKIWRIEYAYTTPPQRKPLTNFDKFNGVDIQFRRSGTDWPKPYRVSITSNKNEREDHRTTVFCNTLDEAIKAAHGSEE